MPGRRGYAAAALVLVAGFAAAGTFLFLRLRDLGAGLHQVVVPGVAELSLEETGEGRSILAFDVDRPGTYVLTGGYPVGSGSEVVLGVAHGFGRRLAGTIAGTLALAFGSAGLGIALTAVTFLRRYRAKRRFAAADCAPG